MNQPLQTQTATATAPTLDLQPPQAFTLEPPAPVPSIPAESASGHILSLIHI